MPLPPPAPPALERLIHSLTSIVKRCLHLEAHFAADLDLIAPEQRASARNLIHYLALRQHDLRPLQWLLSSYGLSSLGRTEPHTLASLDAVLSALHKLADKPWAGVKGVPCDFGSGPAVLQHNAEWLLGASPSNRPCRIMVTMPSEAAANESLVRDLLAAGMDVMRINCAHDDEAAWSAMMANLRRAEKQVRRKCRVLMDLGGPKLRTGEIEGGAEVVRWKPRRDVRGVPVEPAKVWLTAGGAPAGVSPSLSVDAGFLAKMKAGDVVELVDTRGRKRRLEVLSREDDGVWASASQSATVESGAKLRLLRSRRLVGESAVGRLPRIDQPLTLKVGSRLVVTRPGRPGRQGPPATIPTTLPEVLKDIRAGERILFDDGRICGVVRKAGVRRIEVEIVSAAARGARLGSDKGINLPDTSIGVSGLTGEDLRHLKFAAANADKIGLSFVRTREDVDRLQHELEGLGGGGVGIVLKVETRGAFEQLPHLLLEGLQTMPLGVMVARGDLGVEVGFERLAEVQEEILWLAEAAHVPVIWATQVLENMAKTGMPSRAEVTDAAMSGRAECVMLNKGPHIVKTVEFLGDVLERMKRHQSKKRSMLRKLSVSQVILD
ncbi:MAG: pyruvate kinase [Bryobacteraceae bacterium]|nr:pyruvate kinase [Bryobacteraceae bacterium]